MEAEPKETPTQIENQDQQVLKKEISQKPRHFQSYYGKIPEWISFIYRCVILIYALSIMIYVRIDTHHIMNPKMLTNIGCYWTILTMIVGIVQYVVCKKDENRYITNAYYQMYVANFSVLFLITIFYWSWLAKSYDYHSLGCHAILGG